MGEDSQCYSRRGLCLILSSPSGAGKTTLVRRLMEAEPALSPSISVTTRRPRSQEKHGLDYFFVSGEQFVSLRDEGQLLEWAEVFGNFYGTPKEPVQRLLAEGHDIVFDVDWQGARAISARLPEDVVRVFILPPSVEELSRRIHARGTDSPSVIRERLKAAAAEIAHWTEYDYVLVNQDIEECLRVLRVILEAERHRRHRQHGLSVLMAELMGADPDCAQLSSKPLA